MCLCSHISELGTIPSPPRPDECNYDTTDDACVIHIGNRMDESAIWEKIARQQEYCTRRSQVLFELLYVSAIFFPKSHSHPWDY